MPNDTSPGESWLLGVLSDTHASVPQTRKAVRMFASLGVRALLHCGDIGSVEVIQMLAAWPTHYVFGNVDVGYERELREAMAAVGHTCLERFGELEFDGRKIAVLHSDDARTFLDAVQGGRYDLVCHGHTHVARNEQFGGTRLLNPGAVFRANPHSVAVIRMPEFEPTIVPI